MAEKDILEKTLMLHADVFADCINTLVYGGRRKLDEANTRPAPTESFYDGEDGLHNQFCDVSRYLTEEDRYIVQYLIENETQLRRRQVLRTASYQGGAYRQQLEGSSPVYAVISIVIDWTGKSSRIPRSLHSLLEQDGVPPEIVGQVDDVGLTIYHMNGLPEETRRKFTSDLGFIADYLNEGSFQSRSGQRIRHPTALCRMMEALTHDTRFTGQIKELMEKERKGEKVMMSEYINMLEARGEARGEAKGETKLSSLLEKLYSLDRDEEAKQAVLDIGIRARLYEEFQIANPVPAP